jgi:hypothetical protein
VTVPSQALSDAHAYLFDERQRLLELQAENDALKLQEMEVRAPSPGLSSNSIALVARVRIGKPCAGRCGWTDGGG